MPSLVLRKLLFTSDFSFCLFLQAVETNLASKDSHWIYANEVSPNTNSHTDGKSVIEHSLCFMSIFLFGWISAKLFFSEMLSLSSFDVFTSAPFLLCSTARDPFWCLILIWLPTVIWFFGIMKRPVTLLLKVNQTQHGGFYLSWIAASYLQAVLRAAAMLPFRNTSESHYLGLFQQLTLFHLVNKNYQHFLGQRYCATLFSLVPGLSFVRCCRCRLEGISGISECELVIKAMKSEWYKRVNC